MITSEEVRKIVTNIINNNYKVMPEDLSKIIDFKNQQEKVNELLDLYKTVFKNYVVEIDNVRQQQFTFLASEYKIIKGIFIQIEELESELK